MKAVERKRYEALFAAYSDPPSQRDLLIAAVECFAERGFHGTTTRDIAKLTGMSPAALYMHFKDKQDVLFRIVDIVSSKMAEGLHAAAERGGTASERFRALIRAQVKASAELHTAMRVVDTEFDSIDPEQRASILARRDQTEALYARCLEDGVKSGEFTVADVRIAELAVYSLTVAVARWFKDEGQYDEAELAEMYSDLAIGMVARRG